MSYLKGCSVGVAALRRLWRGDNDKAGDLRLVKCPFR